MVKDLVFAAWAPDLSIWTPWVKPVLFAHLTESTSESAPPMQIDTHRFDFVQPRADEAIVVDLPAETSVLAGLVSAGKGFRPVPLYNALPGPANVIDLTGILSALVMGAEHLEKLQLPADAPPAFLLDAQRRGEGADLLPGRFDNRSISLPTDFPSANLLLSRGIRRALLIQDDRLDAQPDLAHTLRRWQDAGIEIDAARFDQQAPPVRINVPKPSNFRRLAYNLLAMMGFKRSPFGGFGGVLPIPSTSSGGFIG